MNMFKPSKAQTIEEYIASVPAERKDAIVFLHESIQKTVPALKPYFATNMLGYGAFPYSNYKKETIDWPVIALANQKQYISVYVASATDGQYAVEKYQNELGKVKLGRSSISFKKLEDVNLSVLKNVIKEAAKNPGFL
jgi:hypothetical protein